MRSIVLWRRGEPDGPDRPRDREHPPTRHAPERSGPTPRSSDGEGGAGDEAARLRRDLERLVRPMADACGVDSPAFRLLCRGVYGPTEDAATDVRRLRLARFAVDHLPPAVRRRITAPPEQHLATVRAPERAAITARGLAERAPSILLVDNRSERVQPVGKALTDAGYRVLRVTDAQTALIAATLLQPSLAVVDILLPSSGGVDSTLLIARLLAGDLPVVVRCSLNVPADRPDLAFVRRSDDRNDLLAVIARLLW